MSTTLTPCPGRRCGVGSHEIGSAAYARCQAIGQTRAGGSSQTNATKPAAATNIDPDLNAFGSVTADTTMVDEDKYTYFYDVELESSTSDASMTVRYGKGKLLVQESGDPTAAEVIASLAREAQDFNNAMDSDDLGNETGIDTEPDYDNLDDDGEPGPSEAAKVYEQLRVQTGEFDALIGDDKELVLEAVRLDEGEEYFDEVTWRQNLGLEIGERDDYDTYGSRVESPSFTVMRGFERERSSEEIDREMDLSFATAGVPSDEAAMVTLQWLGVRTGDAGFTGAAGGQINRRELQEAIGRARKNGEDSDLTERDDRDLIVLDQWVRTHAAD